MSMYTLYETQYPGQQKEPVGFFGNDFGGDMQYPVLNDYKVVGYMGSELWLQSKTGDTTDCIKINFHVDPRSFNNVFAGKVASFKGELVPNRSERSWHYTWTCTKVSR